MARSRKFPFGTIVVATDFSEKSSATLRYAQAIARLHSSELVLVHVIDPIGYAFPGGMPDSLAADRAAHKELNRIEEEVRKQGISIRSVVESGNICEHILETLREYKADLLILGTRGETGAGRAALGAVARQLVAEATCPILTVTPDVEPLLPWAGYWRTVLLATDFSSSSLAALDSSQRIAHRDLLVLHSSATESDAERRTCLERLRFLAPLNESHTVPIEHIVVTGDPATVIIEHAKKHQVDLVVLGSPSRILSEEDLQSSTVLQVISTVSCPVLCIPANFQAAKAHGSAKEKLSA